MLAARSSGGKPHKKVFNSDDERSTTGSTTASGSDHDQSSSSGISDNEDFAMQPPGQPVPNVSDSHSTVGVTSWIGALLRCSHRAAVLVQKEPAAQVHQSTALPVLAPRLAIATTQAAVNTPPWRKLAKKDDEKKDGMPRRTAVPYVPPQRKAQQALTRAVEEAISKKAAEPQVASDAISTAAQRKKTKKHEGAALLAAAVVACQQDDRSSSADEAPLMRPPGLTCPRVPASSLSSFPPGLAPRASVATIGAPPGLAAPPQPPVFDTVVFRQGLTSILRDLAKDRRAATAVLRVRSQRVPSSRQAVEFADILTRAVEEARGGVRQSVLAFAAGLAAGRPSAFEREECAAGVGSFFEEIYTELLEEVPRLQTVCMMEVVPTLRSVFTPEELCPFLPEQFHASMHA